MGGRVENDSLQSQKHLRLHSSLPGAMRDTQLGWSYHLYSKSRVHQKTTVSVQQTVLLTEEFIAVVSAILVLGDMEAAWFPNLCSQHKWREQRANFWEVWSNKRPFLTVASSDACAEHVMKQTFLLCHSWCMGENKSKSPKSLGHWSSSCFSLELGCCIRTQFRYWAGGNKSGKGCQLARETWVEARYHRRTSPQST